MKTTMTVMVTMLAGLFTLATPAAAFTPAMATVDLGTLETGRPSQVTLWYPRGDCAGDTATLCLADGTMTDRVMLLSHGSMGSATDYDWLGNALAAAGYVVAGLNHFNESRLYGPETQDVRVTLRGWQRAQDASGSLDRLAAKPVFSRAVDWTRVVAIGHSAGGQTAALLAGARFDFAQVVAHCTGPDAGADLSCNYGRGAPVMPQAFLDAFGGSYRDARVQRIVLLDPAVGAALLPDSLREVRIPALVVGATQTDFLPWLQQGVRYAAALAGAQVVLLQSGEGHFTFLSPCTHGDRVMGVALCEDRPGVDRVAVQTALATRTIAFVKEGD